MMPPNTYTLIDPQTGNLAFRICSFQDAGNYEDIQRLNHYSLIWIKTGKGTLYADFSSIVFEGDTLFSFSPYQPFKLDIKGKTEGVVLNFHPDFFCIHKHQEEVACNGVLFNNIYEPPFVKINESSKTKLELLTVQMTEELGNSELAQYELLVSYLKIFLITVSRLKAQQQLEVKELARGIKEPFVLQNLKNYIETHFRTKHSAADYADMLAISPKGLARATKSHFNKTLSDMITERIIIEAKRELYLTNKTVKEIAYELGYTDEYYFSRFFKKNVEISPQRYRETVGFARGARPV